MQPPYIIHVWHASKCLKSNMVISFDGRIWQVETMWKTGPHLLGKEGNNYLQFCRVQEDPLVIVQLTLFVFKTYFLQNKFKDFFPAKDRKVQNICYLNCLSKLLLYLIATHVNVEFIMFIKSIYLLSFVVPLYPCHTTDSKWIIYS